MSFSESLDSSGNSAQSVSSKLLERPRIYSKVLLLACLSLYFTKCLASTRVHMSVGPLIFIKQIFSFSDEVYIMATTALYAMGYTAQLKTVELYIEALSFMRG